MKLFLLISLTMAFLLAGCAMHRKKGTSAPPLAQPSSKGSYWEGDDVPGASSIEISLSEQKACFYKGKQLVGESSISTGRKGFETPPGTYKVIQKDKNHVSNLYGDYYDEDGELWQRNIDVTKDPKPESAEFRGAKMPYFLRFTQGYGMHAGYVPAYRASHGCIRLPGTMARHFFENATIGSPVIVRE